MTELKSGTLLQGGKYRIIKTLGQGGFGITYLAEQVMMERKVCIKEFFLKEYCDRDEATSQVSLGTTNNRAMMEKYQVKFLKEARMIARLDHPNIIRILDVFAENNTAYYVMDYIEGKNLNDIVKERGVLPEAEAVNYIRQIGAGLSYVHENGISHLDIKPGNIMLRADGRPVLIDFGMSKQYDESGEQTSTTPIGVSEGYAPLEMYQVGGVSSFSPQTDIYELAATLYRLVTGMIPPKAHEVMNEGLPEKPSTVSVSTWKAVEHGMAFIKKNRPATIGEFLSSLLSVSQSEETVLEPQTVFVEPATEISINTQKEVIPEENVVDKAIRLWRNGDYSQIDIIRSEAIKGNSVAQNTLGNSYYYGLGVPKQVSSAVEWYRKAAEQGLALAQFNLGNCYRYGIGVNKNDLESIKWYQKAAEQGLEEARRFLLGNGISDARDIGNIHLIQFTQKSTTVINMVFTFTIPFGISRNFITFFFREGSISVQNNSFPYNKLYGKTWSVEQLPKTTLDGGRHLCKIDFDIDIPKTTLDANMSTRNSIADLNVFFVYTDKAPDYKISNINDLMRDCFFSWRINVQRTHNSKSKTEWHLID